MRLGENVGYLSYDEYFFSLRTDWHERLSNDTLHWTWLSQRHWNHSAEAVFWMGPAGASTGLHYDDDSMAVLHQFVGEKRVWLYPPECTPYLYPEEECSENEQGTVFSMTSGVSLNNGEQLLPSQFSDPELEQLFSQHFPKIAHAVPQTLTLKAGDALFIPNGYWHAVESLSMGISVTVHAPSLCEEASTWVYDWVEALMTRGWLGAHWRSFCIRPYSHFFTFAWWPSAHDDDDDDDDVDDNG